MTETITIQPQPIITEPATIPAETGWSRLRRFGAWAMPYAAVPVLWVGRMATAAADYVFSASRKVRIGVGLALVAMVLAVVAVNVHRKTSFGVKPELPKVSEYYTKKELRELQRNKKKQPPKRAAIIKKPKAAPVQPPKAKAVAPAPRQHPVPKAEAEQYRGTRQCDEWGWCWFYF
jgi:outer membrane biosynthesis protein TonB